MRKRNKLYTANKWNQPMFAQDIDREHQNIFDGMFSSTLNTSISKPTLFNSSSGLNYQTPQLSKPNTTIPTDWSNGVQRASAVGSTNAMVNNFGTEASQNNPFSQYTPGGSGIMGKAAAGKALMGAGMEIAGQVGKSGKNPRGLWDAADPVHQLAGGRESAVGNSLEDAGVSVFKSGAQSGNGWTMLAGAGLKVVGGLTNAAFGIKTDKERLNAINSGLDTLRNYTSNASSFDEIQGPAAMVDNTSGVYKGGWFSGKKARKKNAKLTKEVAQAESWANRSIDNNIDNIASTQMDNMLANYAAFGGPLGSQGAIDYNFMSDYLTAKNKAAEGKNKVGGGNIFGSLQATPFSSFALGGDMQTNGADYSTGLTHIDAGNSHEENPYDGVQMGISSENGQPNLVEEGETVFDDYVFSRRIKVPKEAQKSLGVSGNNLTFADATKQLEKESLERPNDPISSLGLKASMSKLADEQEFVKRSGNYKVGQIYDMEPDELALLIKNGFEYEEVK